MTAITSILWAILGPILRPIGQRIFWATVTEAADSALTDESAEKMRADLIRNMAKRIESLRAKLPTAGDPAADRLANWLGVVLHSNRLTAMGKGATWESASAFAEEVWGRVDPANTSRFSGERQP